MAVVEYLDDEQLWNIPIEDLITHTLDQTTLRSGSILTAEYRAKAKAIFDLRAPFEASRESARAAKWSTGAAVAAAVAAAVSAAVAVFEAVNRAPAP